MQTVAIVAHKIGENSITSIRFFFVVVVGAIYSASMTAAIQMYRANAIADGQRVEQREEKEKEIKRRRRRWIRKYTNESSFICI